MESTQTEPRSIADLKPKMCLQGIVKETFLYGAMVDIGLERTGLVHISQLAPTRTNRVTDVVQSGDSVTVWVTKIDAEKGRISLTMVEPPRVDWHELAEEKTHTGTVTRLESYGVFVDIGAERPGLMHIREMSSGYVRHPSELVKIGDEIDVKILKLDRRKRRIDLTMASFEEALEDDEEAEAEPVMTAMEIALQQARSGQRESESRHEKPRRPDLAEREAILAQTLREHSQH